MRSKFTDRDLDLLPVDHLAGGAGKGPSLRKLPAKIDFHCPKLSGLDDTISENSGLSFRFTVSPNKTGAPRKRFSGQRASNRSCTPKLALRIRPGQTFTLLKVPEYCALGVL